jgi:hypothetical protein
MKPGALTLLVNAMVVCVLLVGAALPVVMGIGAGPSSWLIPLAFASVAPASVLAAMRRTSGWFARYIAAAINVACFVALLGISAAATTGLGGAGGLLIVLVPAVVLTLSNAVVMSRCAKRES